MKKLLYLFICVTIILAIAVGCSSLITATPDETGAGAEAGNAAKDRVGVQSDSGDSEADSQGTEADNGQGTNGSASLNSTPDSTADDTTDWKPTAFETVNNFDGVSMEVRSGTIAPTGLTLTFINQTDSECIYGEYFVIEKKIAGSWYQVPIVIEGNYGFESIGYSLEPKGESEWTSDWKWIYGSLDLGEYRIVKDISDFRGTGDYDKYYLAAEFKIEVQ